MAQPVQRPLKQQSRNPSRGGPQQQNGIRHRHYQADTSNNVNDAATVNYIKRILCPKRQDTETASEDKAQDQHPEPLEELLPPLTSSNAVDVQLYAFIAVILSLFVQAWYNRITPDQQFVAEIVQIIAHSTRALEQRLRKVDLEALLLDELPLLVEEHIDGT